MSFVCPECKDMAKTINTKRRKGFTVRRMECIPCNIRFSTHEVLVKGERGIYGPQKPMKKLKEYAEAKPRNRVRPNDKVRASAIAKCVEAAKTGSYAFLYSGNRRSAE